MDSDRTPSIDVFLADPKSRRDLATGHAAEHPGPLADKLLGLLDER